MQNQDTPPVGYCQCGCGERTKLAPQTVRAVGWVKGEPLRYIRNHHRRRIGPDWIAQDAGHTTPCWVWQGTQDSSGYGMKWDIRRGKAVKAHRLSYELRVGPIPPGLEIDHLCRNRPCVNPDHLEPVTGTENRRRWGKLSMDAARAIRATYAAGGVRQVDLAREYGVSQTVISAVVRNKIWREGA